MTPKPRLSADQHRAVVCWLLAHQHDLASLRVGTQQAWFNLRKRDVATLSFWQFARIYRYLRTTGQLTHWPLQRGISEPRGQQLLPFIVENAA